ncbi:YceI family protein [Actinotalea sp. K2]|uniref:YceI family protein n=1 Tax=Actinotalea sp. K2 TaxID=2939438 RepID=UPI0020174E9D|nr:YceI family protein [Actinotalea sp. K2]MCL3859648.1 YceI family protein [Actinotalea sp. K2]
MVTTEPARPRPRTRRLLVVGFAAALLVAAVLGGPWLYARVLAPEPPAVLGISPPAAGAVDSGTGPVDVDGSWEVAEGSEAGYRLDEVLSGQPVTVVGRTEEVGGTLVVQDGVLVSADVTVQVASIETDESARDAYFRRALRVADLPEARFTLAEPVDLTGLADEGSVQVDAVGTFTLHGVTRPATVTLDARRTADGFDVAGSLPVVLTDHDLTAPDLGFVTVQDEGVVEMLLRVAR